MTLTRRTRLVATSALSAVLAAGGLSLASGPAHAASSTQSATYGCTNPGTGATVTVPATIGLTNLPDDLATGVTVSDAGYTIALDENALSTLLNGLSGTVNTVSTQIGTTPVTSPVTGLLTGLASGLGGVSGTLGTFTIPGSGDLPIPTSLDVGTALGLLGPVASCTLNPASTSPVTVVSSSGTTSTVTSVGKQRATLKAHQVGHTKMLLVKVKNQTGKATGKVIAKAHGTKVGKGTLKNGKLRMKLKKLKNGVNRIKLSYAGDALTNAAKKSVKVKVGSTHR